MLDIVKFDRVIALEDIEKCNGVSGVWARFSKDGICLDVCQTDRQRNVFIN